MMSQARFRQAFSGLSSAAQKVYEHVPAQEVWPSSDIYNALRKANVNQSFDVVGGCLRALVNAGVVKESKLGYVREPIRKTPSKRIGLADLKDVMQETPAAPAPTPVPAPAPKTEDKKEKPMALNPTQQLNIVDTIGNLAQRMQAMAQRHQQEVAELTERHAQELKDLADLVSDSAIEVQAQFEKGEADLAAFRQLQTLFKTLNLGG